MVGILGVLTINHIGNNYTVLEKDAPHRIARGVDGRESESGDEDRCVCIKLFFIIRIRVSKGDSGCSC